MTVYEVSSAHVFLDLDFVLPCPAPGRPSLRPSFPKKRVHGPCFSVRPPCFEKNTTTKRSKGWFYLNNLQKERAEIHPGSSDDQADVAVQETSAAALVASSAQTMRGPPGCRKVLEVGRAAAGAEAEAPQPADARRLVHTSRSDQSRKSAQLTQTVECPLTLLLLRTLHRNLSQPAGSLKGK
ncbi:hypothetical protein ANCCAN_16442 [Ancylostoma caninum]|uniref:Uncharacterized protein n=1 Tax=Ancylostoma caninum TaxID=29170 RepID=A0A368G3U4_ANCCA|nr:hypothetical protein ANCCAN_16442 [Ancylostoma caninum]